MAAQPERQPVIQGKNRGNLSDIIRSRVQEPMQIDADLVEAAGIRKFSGKHIDVYTDDRDRDDLEELVDVFDQAIDFWCDYFSIDPAETSDWKLSGFIMVDLERFRSAGVYPDNLPSFPAGYQRGHEMWLFVQPGSYYTRHLFLHEGTHAFMYHYLGGSGPPWYSEGMAELLSVHRWENGKLQMNYRHNRREDVPYWGRVKIVKKDLDDSRGLGITDVMSYQNHDFRNLPSYAWAWAACRFFDSHPQYQQTFRDLPSAAADQTITFSRKFWDSLAAEHESINRDWQLFLKQIDYGINMTAVLVSDADRDADGSFKIAAHRGWQATGITVVEGQQIRVSATGRIVVREDFKPWESEAGGITIEYFNGRPIGMLLGAVVSESDLQEGNFSVESIGSSSEFKAAQDGELYLKINEGSADYFDNSGEYSVQVNQ